MFKSLMEVPSLEKYGVLTLTLLYLTTIQAAVLPGDSTITNIRNPSTQSKVMGPDGSVIVDESSGRQIVQQETPGIFEPAGRILGTVDPVFNPMVAGPPAETLATGTYVAQSGQDGAQSLLGGVVGPRG